MCTHWSGTRGISIDTVIENSLQRIGLQGDAARCKQRQLVMVLGERLIIAKQQDGVRL